MITSLRTIQRWFNLGLGLWAWAKACSNSTKKLLPWWSFIGRFSPFYFFPKIAFYPFFISRRKSTFCDQIFHPITDRSHEVKKRRIGAVNIGQCCKRSNSRFRLVSRFSSWGHEQITGLRSRFVPCRQGSNLASNSGKKFNLFNIVTLTLVAFEQPLYYKASQILWYPISLVSLSAL